MDPVCNMGHNYQFFIMSQCVKKKKLIVIVQFNYAERAEQLQRHLFKKWVEQMLNKSMLLTYIILTSLSLCVLIIQRSIDATEVNLHYVFKAKHALLLLLKSFTNNFQHNWHVNIQLTFWDTLLILHSNPIPTV